MQAHATHRVARVKRAEPYRSEVVTADIVRLVPLNVLQDVVQVQVIDRVVLARHLAPQVVAVLEARAVVHRAVALSAADQVSAAVVAADSGALADAGATRILARASTSIAL